MRTSIALAIAALTLASTLIAQAAPPATAPAEAKKLASPWSDTREQTLAAEKPEQKALRDAVKAVGGYIVFSITRDGNSEVYRMDADGSNLTQLTKMTAGLVGAAGRLEPRIDPTGKLVSFLFTPPKGKADPKAGIYVIDIDGKTAPKFIVEASGGGSWSPDGKAMVTAKYSREKDAHIWIVDVATGAKKEITPPNTRNNFQPYWSRDGKTIVTTWQSVGNWTLAAVAADPEKKEIVGEWKSPVRIDGCNWELNPAGDAVAWVRDHAGDTYGSIWIAPFDLNKVSPGKWLSNGVAPSYNGDQTWNYFPAFSPDGNYVVFARCPGYKEALAMGWKKNKYSGEKMDFYVTPAKGGVMARLTWGLDEICDPDWAKKAK